MIVLLVYLRYSNANDVETNDNITDHVDFDWQWGFVILLKFTVVQGWEKDECCWRFNSYRGQRCYM